MPVGIITAILGVPFFLFLLREGDNMIRAEGITVQRGGKRILDSVCLSVPAGSFVGIIGPNGSGKTTLMNVLARLITPDGGTVMRERKGDQPV